MDKVKIISMTDGQVGVTLPEYHFARTWQKKGASVMVEKEMLENLMMDAGFEYMINHGILYIEDMKTKQELGIEPENATEPVNIKVLTDKDKETYWKKLTLANFKDKVAELHLEQINDLAGYAIANKIMNLDKCKVIKELCGRDIIETIRLDNEDKE